MKPKVYLETTIISYLAAKPSRDLIVAAHQQLTHVWWEKRRAQFLNFTSDLVIQEASEGDPIAASHRASFIHSCRILEADVESQQLATKILEAGYLPMNAKADALHIAIAAVNEMDFLVTWNCSHINNAVIKTRIESICAIKGYRGPTICTPEELLGGLAEPGELPC